MSENDRSPENLPHENLLIGQTIIAGQLTLDNGQWVNELQQAISRERPQTDKDKVRLASKLAKSHLLDALNPTQTDIQSIVAVGNALARESTMSEILEGGYGVCKHFNAYALVALEEMGVQGVLFGNPDYHHTFLYVNVDGEWEVADPFAEVFFANKEGDSHLFPPECYQGDSLKMFAQTSTVTEPPETRPPQPTKTEPNLTQSLSQPTTQMSELRNRLLSRRRTNNND